MHLLTMHTHTTRMGDSGACPPNFSDFPDHGHEDPCEPRTPMPHAVSCSASNLKAISCRSNPAHGSTIPLNPGWVLGPCREWGVPGTSASRPSTGFLDAALKPRLWRDRLLYSFIIFFFFRARHLAGIQFLFLGALVSATRSCPALPHMGSRQPGRARMLVRCHSWPPRLMPRRGPPTRPAWVHLGRPLCCCFIATLSRPICQVILGVGRPCPSSATRSGSATRLGRVGLASPWLR